MDTEAVGHASFPELAQENHIFPHFLYGNVEILHPRIDVFEVIQLVVVSGEKCLGPLAVFMDIFHYCPGY